MLTASSTTPPPTWPAAKLDVRPEPLLDQRQQPEHRQVHRDDDHADHEAYADHHDRLDDRGQRRDRRVDLVLVEVGDLAEHLLQLSRPAALRAPPDYLISEVSAAVRRLNQTIGRVRRLSRE